MAFAKGLTERTHSMEDELLNWLYPEYTDYNTDLRLNNEMVEIYGCMEEGDYVEIFCS